MPLPNLHSLDEVAARFHVTPRRLKDHLRIHPIGRRLGRQWLFTDADVLELINSLECVDGEVRACRAPSRLALQKAETSNRRLQAVLERLKTKPNQKAAARSSAVKRRGAPASRDEESS